MPAARGKAVQQEVDIDNLLLIVGQLLEASKVTSENLKNLGADVRHNETAIITATQTIELLEKSVSQLNVVVRTGNGREPLVATVNSIKASQDTLRATLASLEAKVQSLQASVDALSSHNLQQQSHSKGISSTMLMVLCFVGWLITTVITLVGVVRSN